MLERRVNCVLRRLAAVVVLVAGCAGDDRQAGYQPDPRHFDVAEDTGRCESGGVKIFCSQIVSIRVPDGYVYCDLEIEPNSIQPPQPDPFRSNASGYRITEYPSRCAANGHDGQDVHVQLWSRTRGVYGEGPAWTDLTVRATLLDLNSEFLPREQVDEAIRYCKSLRPEMLAHLPSKFRIPADLETMFRPDSACAPGECRDCYCTDPERHYYNVVDEIDENTPGCRCEKACK